MSAIVASQAQKSEERQQQDGQDQQQQQQQPIEYFSKLKVSQLQTFLKDRGQQWDYAEKRNAAAAADADDDDDDGDDDGDDDVADTLLQVN